MGVSESLRGRFSHSMDPILHFLVSNQGCLNIGASLSISWTIPSCMVLVSFCRSLSLKHFLPKASYSLLFLSRHILSICCHFLLDVLGYAHWSRSSFYILHLSWAWYFILWSIFLFIFSTRLLQEGERHVFTFTSFLRDPPWLPYHFSLWSFGWKWIRDILL